MLKDPNILLSIINTKLRDFYNSLEDLCEDLNYDLEEVINILSTINYYYDRSNNKFINKGENNEER